MGSIGLFQKKPLLKKDRIEDSEEKGYGQVIVKFKYIAFLPNDISGEYLL